MIDIKQTVIKLSKLKKIYLRLYVFTVLLKYFYQYLNVLIDFSSHDIVVYILIIQNTGTVVMFDYLLKSK